MIYNPYTYKKNNSFTNADSFHIESGKENWGGIFGLFVFPVFLVFGTIALFNVLKGNALRNNISYQNGGFLNSGTQIGVGGAPPTGVPVTQTDLRVHSSNFISGAVDGFISQTAYENGARVYVSAQTTFEQECTKNAKTVKELQSTTVNKGIESYSAPNPLTESNDYVWAVNFDVKPPINLCPSGYTKGDVTQTKAEGRVFLSKDGGITQLTDTRDTPIQVGLTP